MRKKRDAGGRRRDGQVYMHSSALRLTLQAARKAASTARSRLTREAITDPGKRKVWGRRQPRCDDREGVFSLLLADEPEPCIIFIASSCSRVDERRFSMRSMGCRARETYVNSGAVPEYSCRVACTSAGSSRQRASQSSGSRTSQKHERTETTGALIALQPWAAAEWAGWDTDARRAPV